MGTARIRKGLALTGAAVLALTALAACSSSKGASGGGSSGGSSSGKSLTVYANGGGGGGQQQQEKEYYSFLAQQFHAATGATVNFEFFSSGAEENSKIQTSIAAGTGPDVFGYGSSLVGTLASTNAFHVLTDQDWNQVGGRSSFLTGQLGMSGKDASSDIGIPSISVPYVIAYNTEMFSKAGISTPPTTWDQYVADAKKVMAANPGVYGTGFDPADPLDPWKFMWSYSHQLGGKWISADGKTAQISAQPTQQAFDFYFSWYQDHLVPPESLTWTDAQMFAAFTAGKIAMMPIATEGTAASAASTPIQGKIGFAPLPSVPAGMSARPAGASPAEAIVAGTYWTIPKYAEGKLNLALQFAKVSISPAVEEKQYALLGWMPVTTAGMSSLVAKNPSAKPFADVVAQAEPTEFTPAWTYIQTGITTAVSQIGARIATSGKYASSYAASVLKQQNASVQAHL